MRRRKIKLGTMLILLLSVVITTSVTATEGPIIGVRSYAGPGESFSVSVSDIEGIVDSDSDLVSFIKAQYDGEQLVNVSIIDASKSQSEQEASFDIKIPENQEGIENMKIRYFLWSDMSGIQPLALPETTYGYSYEFYVSPEGDDANNGVTAPFKTIERAQEAVRSLPDDIASDVIVNIASGTYYLDDMLRFYPEDSGRNGNRIIYRGENMPTVSGGTPVKGFVKSEVYENLWEVQLDVDEVTELYINDVRAQVANSDRQVFALDTFDDTETTESVDGLYVDAADISQYENASDMYLNYTGSWTFTKARVSSVEAEEGTDRFIVRMNQPSWNSHFEASSGRPQLTDGFVISNAFELLDKPGEYYFNRQSKMLYYFPRKGEDMNTATVVIPNLDILVKIDGYGSENCVKNITFEGIRFAHTQNSAFYDTDFYSSKQGLNMPYEVQGTKTNKSTLVAAVELNHTDGIEFENNDFVGLGAVGINMVEGVMNTSVSGNVFADIGDVAIAFGHSTHSDAVIGEDGVGDLPSEDAQLDLTANAMVSASYRLGGSAMRYDFTTEGKYSFGAPKFVSEAEFSYINSDGDAIEAWSSDPSPTEKQYVKYDFLDYYTVDKIVIGFSPGNDRSTRMNYEVLLSNDPDFEDESTITVTVDTVPSTKNTYTVDSDVKYRYAMVRKTDLEQFKINRLSVLSNDIAPYADTVRCKNIEISNNYITRVGIGNGIIGSGAAINSYGYEEGISIVHNEIYNLPYSAIQIGYGWDNTLTGARNNYVAYNRIEKINQILYDGGGIYTLSDQTGWVAEKNFINNLTDTVGALYCDRGSSNELWRNNVVYDAQRAIYLGAGTKNNKYENTYSTVSYTYAASASDMYKNPPTVTSIAYGNIALDAEKIVNQTGLEPTFEAIKDRAPYGELAFVEERGVLVGTQRATSYFGHKCNMVSEGIEEVNNGEFGILFGQYPEEVKLKLAEYAELPFDDETLDMFQRNTLLVGVRDYLRGLAVRRLSYSEMLDYCAAAEENAFSTHSTADIEALNTSVAQIKTDVQNNVLTEEEAVRKLEAAYNTFFRARSEGGFEAAFAQGMADSEIDFETKSIVFSFYPGDDLTDKEVTLRALDGTQTVQVYNLTSDRAVGDTGWTLKAQEYYENSGEYVQSFSGDNRLRVISDNEVLLIPGLAPYMQRKWHTSADILEFKPQRVNDGGTFTIIFGAKTASDLIRSSDNSLYNRFELELSADTAVLYSYNGADGRTELSKCSIDDMSGEYHTFAYDVETMDSSYVLKVFIDGKELMKSEITSQNADGYRGIITEEMSVRVKQ